MKWQRNKKLNWNCIWSWCEECISIFW